MELKVLERVLDANDAWAQENRLFLRERGIAMFNIIGSPGAGKTAFLEKTIDLLGGAMRIGVIEGDIATSIDAQRIQKKGVPVYQINTGTACHLDANLVNSALKDICRDNFLECVFVENIGNLVCPAEFDVGECAKIAVLSVTEGDDKVEKYPLLFSEAAYVVISKIGLLQHTNFNLTKATLALSRLNSKALLSTLDSISGVGFEKWIAYLKESVQAPGVERVK